MQREAERHLLQRHAVVPRDLIQGEHAPQQRDKVDRGAVAGQPLGEAVRRRQQQSRRLDALPRQPSLAQARLDEHAGATHQADREQRGVVLLQQIERYLEVVEVGVVIRWWWWW